LRGPLLAHIMPKLFPVQLPLCALVTMLHSVLIE